MPSGATVSEIHKIQNDLIITALRVKQVEKQGQFLNGGNHISKKAIGKDFIYKTPLDIMFWPYSLYLQRGFSCLLVIICYKLYGN